MKQIEKFINIRIDNAESFSKICVMIYAPEIEKMKKNLNVYILTFQNVLILIILNVLKFINCLN